MRSKSNLLLTISVIAIVCSTQTSAQETKALPSPKASIDELDWIAGQWEGEAMGGKFEETWNPSKAGGLMGMFKFIDENGIKFYEILTIVPKGDSLVLRLKHFHSDLVGWEEKDKSVEFPLVSISQQAARFDGLIFKKINPDEMHIEVVIEQKDGQTQELKFECHRVNKSSPNGAKEEIARVFATDSVLSRQRDQLPQKHSLATAVRAYVLGLDSIDFSKCPAEYAEAFKMHRNAWNDSISFFEKHDGLHGEMHAVIDKIRTMDTDVVSELDKCMLPIFDTWKAVENEGKKHGIE